MRYAILMAGLMTASCAPMPPPPAAPMPPAPLQLLCRTPQGACQLPNAGGAFAGESCYCMNNGQAVPGAMH
jgi:hypothetical protein